MRRAVLIAIAVPASACAGVNRWTSVGPEGGSIRMLVIDPLNPQTLYAARYNGSTFKSSDGGMHWSSTDFPIGPVTIDPQDSATLYVAGMGRGVYKSTDAGTTWKTAKSGLPDRGYLWSLAIDPQDSKTLYVTVGLTIFKSTDGAETWSAVSSLPDDNCGCVLFLAIDPRDSKTLYAAELDGVGGYEPRLYKSRDGGANWKRIPESEEFYSDGMVVIDPQQRDTIYAVACQSSSGTDEGCDFWTVFKSKDGGENWNAANSGLPENARTLWFDPCCPDRLYATAGWGIGYPALFKTTDGGASWTEVKPPLAAYTLAIDSRNPGTVYAGTGNGVWKSTDGTASWSPANSGLILTDVSALAIGATGPRAVYAVENEMEVSGSFLFKSTDEGESWRALTPPSAQILNLIPDPLNAGTLYALTLAGIFKSIDGGESWGEEQTGVEGPATALALDPTNFGTAYAASGFGTAGFGIFKTTDSGAQWRRIGRGPPDGFGGMEPVHILAIDPQNPATIYALSRFSFNQLYKSTDAGVSFSPASSGLTLLANGATGGIRAFAIDRQNSRTLYGWLNSRLFKSTNGAADWAAMTPGLPDGVDISSLVIDPRNAGTLYAGTSSGLFRSRDGGANWTVMNDGLKTLRVNAVAIDPRNGQTVYAGTEGGGVFAITLID